MTEVLGSEGIPRDMPSHVRSVGPMNMGQPPDITSSLKLPIATCTSQANLCTLADLSFHSSSIHLLNNRGQPAGLTDSMA